MRKWTAAALIAAVLMGAGCRGKGQAAGEATGAAASGAPGATAAGNAPADEETVPGGFTVDTQKVENLEGAGTTVNEPD